MWPLDPDLTRTERQRYKSALLKIQKTLAVTVADLTAATDDRISPLKLSEQKSRCEFTWQIGGADIHPSILVHITTKEAFAIGSLFPDDFSPVYPLWVVHQQGSPLAADDVLGFMETDTPEMANRSQGLPAIRRKQRLRCIFYDPRVMTLRQIQDGIHFAGNSCVVHGNDCPGFRGDRSLDPHFIQIQRVRSNVDKYRNPAAQHKSVRGRHEGERGHDNLIARLDVGQNGGHFQCRRSGVCEQGHAAFQCLLQPFMAAFREGAIAGQMAIVTA